MIWLTWRQFRLQALAVAAIAIAFALVLAATGRRLADLAATYRDVFDHLTANDRHLFYAGIVIIAVAPVIIGVFWGAPLVARELEAGTQRLESLVPPRPTVETGFAADHKCAFWARVTPASTTANHTTPSAMANPAP